MILFFNLTFGVKKFYQNKYHCVSLRNLSPPCVTYGTTWYPPVKDIAIALVMTASVTKVSKISANLTHLLPGGALTQRQKHVDMSFACAFKPDHVTNVNSQQKSSLRSHKPLYSDWGKTTTGNQFGKGRLQNDCGLQWFLKCSIHSRMKGQTAAVWETTFLHLD